MKPASKIIENTVNSIFMKKVIREKGWTKQDAAYHVVEFLTCGEKISLYDFMMGK